MKRPDFQYPKLQSERDRETWPPTPVIWFLAGSAVTLAVLAILGVLP
jgi:hypothetical protein